MDDPMRSDEPVYALTQTDYRILEELRTQLFMMALLARARTSVEEEVLLQVPRWILAQNFALLAAQLTDVLSDVKQITPTGDRTCWTH